MSKFVVYKIPCNSQCWCLQRVCVFYSYDDAYHYCDQRNKRSFDDNNSDTFYNYEFAKMEE